MARVLAGAVVLYHSWRIVSAHGSLLLAPSFRHSLDKAVCELEQVGPWLPPSALYLGPYEYLIHL